MAGTPAGRLSVEIVADIARLQKDLDAAKRQVSKASIDMGMSAKHANDNIARIGTTSRAQKANLINFGRQIQDVGTMAALGAPPMQIFASQAAQVGDVLAMMSAEAKKANTSLLGMARGGLVKAGPYLLVAGAAAGTFSAALNALQNDINKTSKVTVTWGDVALGTFDAIGSYLSGKLTQAFEYFGIDVGAVWEAMATGARDAGNRLVGHFVAAKNVLIAAWQTFPAAFGEFFIDAANGAIGVLEGLINGGIGLLNKFSSLVNETIGTSIGRLDMIDIPGIENRFRGAGQVAGTALADALSGSYKDYIGDFAEFVSPFAQARAVRRLEEDAEDAGKKAGKKLGKAAKDNAQAELAKLFDDAFSDLAREVDALNNERAQTRAVQERINQLLLERKAVGLVGWQRERLILSLEHQANIQSLLSQKAAAEASEQMAVADALQRRIELLNEMYNLQIEDGDVQAAYDAHEDAIYELSDLYETLFTDGIGGVWDQFERQGMRAIAQLAAEWTLSLISGQSGSSPSNNPIASIFSSVFGGSAAGGSAGAGVAQGAASAGSSVASIFGGGGAGAGGALAAAGPVGMGIAAISVANSIAGDVAKVLGVEYSQTGGMLFGLVGGFLGPLLSGADRGSAIISGGGISGYYGDTQKYKDEAGGLAGNVLQSIDSIAEALGATVNSGAGRVSIGIRDGNYRVDPQGRGYTKTSRYADIMDFGKDAEAAVAAAITDLLKDGVITGISNASMNIIKAGGDLQKAIEKAILIESVPKLLKERLDPLGYALDEIDVRFQKLADALREGGATAKQFADAEKLYSLERQDAIEQFSGALGTLQGFLADMTAGPNSPLSVRQQYMTAEAEIAKYEAAVAAGEMIDATAATKAGQTFIDLSRQANASSGAFFTDFDRVGNLTRDAIGNLENGSGVPGEGSVVFAQQTASATQSMARMQEDTNLLLRDIRQAINDNGGSVDGSAFIGSNRGFG